MTIAYKLIDNEKKLDLILKGYVFSSALMSFYVYQVGRNENNRVEGIGPVDAAESNMLAATLAPSILIAGYYYIFSKDKKNKLVFILSSGIILNALILINSRGSIVGLAIGLLYFIKHMYISKLRSRFQRVYITFLILFSLGISLQLVDNSFINRMLSIEDTKVHLEEESGATRTEYWKAAWELAKDRPFGSGWHAFHYFAPLYLPENLNTGASRNRAVHSTWFQALSEIGYLGLISIIMLFISSIFSLKKCLKTPNISKEQYYKIIAIISATITLFIIISFIDRLRAEILYWFVLFSSSTYNIFILRKTHTKKELAKSNVNEI